MDKKIIIIGASGHGKVVADLAIKNGYEILGFLESQWEKFWDFRFWERWKGY